MARPKTKATTVTQVLDVKQERRGLGREGTKKRCSFCDKEASDSIPMHDLNLNFRKALPKKQQRRIPLDICELHYNKYVIRPQIKANLKIIRRIDRMKNNKK